MAKLLDFISKQKISRRSFLKGSAAATAALAASGLIGCNQAANSLAKTTTGSASGSEVPTTTTAPSASEEVLYEDEYVRNVLEGGKWQPVPCSQGCASHCVNYGYVVDGVVVRQKTDDTHEDTLGERQIRSCIKGRALRKKMYAPDRLNYPMKRKHWQPGGGENSHGELRGIDEWEQISWDEALDLVAEELKRIKENYGNRAFYAPGLIDWRLGALGSLNSAWLLYAYGGCTTVWGAQSSGCESACCFTMQGLSRTKGNDRMSLMKSKLIVMFGVNYSWTVPNAFHLFAEAKKNGAKVIMIDPWLSPSAQGIADQWIPVRPGTDGAFLLGVAYHMIENNLQNQEFLDKYTLGFDADHMPDDAVVEENYKDYVLGIYDDTPKTPEWAAPICGVSADIIRAFAEEIATTKPMSWRCSYAPCRTDNGPSFIRNFLTVGWMTGNQGVPGGDISSQHIDSGFGGQSLIRLGASGLIPPTNDHAVCTMPFGDAKLSTGVYDPDQFYGLAYNDAYDAIMNHECHDFIHGMTPIDIHCIYKIGIGAPMNQNCEVMKAIKAYRSVDFVVTSDLFMTTDCCYSDIVLPAAGPWERPWTDVLCDSHNEQIVFGRQVSEPAFERKVDSWIEIEIGKRLGIPEEEIMNISLEQAAYNRLAGAEIMQDDGTYTTLCTITEEDIAEMGVEGTPQTGIVPLKELMETGHYHFKREVDDDKGMIGDQAFFEDPKANPVATKSGKYEIHCQSYSDVIGRFGFSTEPALPKYRPAVEGYEESLTSEYNLQMISIHHMSHSHNTFANVPETHEMIATNLIMNSQDADALGVKTNDTVLISSAVGKVLRRVTSTPRIMPGVVIMAQGSWLELDEDGIDRGGNPNVLCTAHKVGEGREPWNTTLVKVEKWIGEPLEADCYKEARIIKF